MRLGTPRAVNSTIGQTSMIQPALDKPYRYKGRAGWTPSAVQFRERGEPETPRRGLSADNRCSAEAKAARFALFCEAREAEPEGSVAAAGRIAGVTSKTAQAYERERKQQQRGEVAQ